jgi:hypothetical protein
MIMQSCHFNFMFDLILLPSALTSHCTRLYCADEFVQLEEVPSLLHVSALSVTCQCFLAKPLSVVKLN